MKTFPFLHIPKSVGDNFTLFVRRKQMKGITVFFLITILISSISYSANPIYSGLPTPGIRPQSLGNAFVAVADDVNAIFWNPAGISLLKDRQLQVEHTNLHSLDITYNQFAYAEKQFGGYWSHLDSGDFLMGGGDFTLDIYAIGGAYQVQPLTYLGAVIKFIQMDYNPPAYGFTSTIEDLCDKRFNTSCELFSFATSNGYSIDVGLLHLVDEFTKVGLTIHDLTSKIDSDFPSSMGDRYDPDIHIGFSRRPDKNSLYTAELGKIGAETEIHIGVEKKLQDNMALRIGLDDDVFTAGFGFVSQQWELNYSYKNDIDVGLGNTQRFGAVIHF